MIQRKYPDGEGADCGESASCVTLLGFSEDNLEPMKEILYTPASGSGQYCYKPVVWQNKS